MNRKSLSTSLGSWYIQLIYNPARDGRPHTERTSSLALLYLPPYIALIFGIGAGCQALAHFITLGPLTVYLQSALAISVAISYGARVAPPRLARFCAGLRWPFVLVLLFLAISTRSSSLLPPESEGEGNSIVAVLVGLTSILSVLLVGVRSGGRTVPVSAPLVPGLSLFGLLSLVSVDTVIQICFLVFVTSALYILAYERFLRRYVHREDGLESQTRRNLPSVPALVRWSSGALLVCSVWFALFMVGGAVFYYPVQTVLPRLVSPQLSRMRAAAQGTLMDYRGSSAVMELRGGTYVLSDREVMRITVQSGEASGLWRGRVYDRYERSRWSESDTLFPVDTEPGEFPAFGLGRRYRRSLRQENKIPPIDAGLGSYNRVIELVEPAEGSSLTVFASGLVENRRERPDLATRPSEEYDYLRVNSPYLVTSHVIRPRLPRLTRVPFINREALNKMPTTHAPRAALAPAEDEDTRRTMSALAQQIKLGSRTPIDGPYAAVRAVSDYLIDNCAYSLSSPTVPASQDAVVYFLTNSHTGACDMFASSMALLLRELGVPARVVTGYLQPEALHSGARGSGERPTWIVREKDAHAWVEYYVSGLGWLPYDPTAGTRTADDSISGQLAELLALPTLQLPPRMLLLPALGLTLLLVGLFWSVWEKRMHSRVVLTAEEVDRARITQAYRQAVHSLRRRVPHEPHYTPREYDDRVSRSSVPQTARQEFAALTLLYREALFQATPPQIPAEELENSVKRIRASLASKVRELH